ncbi:MAG: hypothetical protein ACOYOA_11465 [Saprospiraceae bacterium]
MNALKLMLGLLSAVVLFHLLIITQIIPYNIVWAGRLKSITDMLYFESSSLAINLFLILVLLLKGVIIRNSISPRILNSILWFFVGLFAVNTIGNLFAETLFEKIVFTPLTFISAIMIWKIIGSDPGKTNSGENGNK